MPLPQYIKYENICKSTQVLVIIIYIIKKNGSSMQRVVYCDGGTLMPVILLVLGKSSFCSAKRCKKESMLWDNIHSTTSRSIKPTRPAFQPVSEKKGLLSRPVFVSKCFPKRLYSQTASTNRTAYLHSVPEIQQMISSRFERNVGRFFFSFFPFQSKQKPHGRQTKVMEALVQLDGGNTVNRK